MTEKPAAGSRQQPEETEIVATGWAPEEGAPNGGISASDDVVVNGNSDVTVPLRRRTSFTLANGNHLNGTGEKPSSAPNKQKNPFESERNSFYDAKEYSPEPATEEDHPNDKATQTSKEDKSHCNIL